ncbi:hypothetical protein PHYSODRAFT_504294 [Phytophthora sojae]|uniref:YrhK domain-containing protein n=1 Tax=Phytophthora sojae (strain P6497) TaxID=1094619 RepID=G4ZE28_PHYSP|nr:hypothetical protein PHYSODRAFT_504294 [Phytophthora sojae]EGZ16949.1 hypothetical protein PHYSODRAFT_504294 [Phytophthora sojae]|eukprot:XP_009526007.1 hypothetical protein PHYSODRAFT_504294 [Phytophthora sojae]
MPGITPRNSNYSLQITPRLPGPDVLLPENHLLESWEKWLEVSRVLAYLLGSLLFLLGSIYFFPKYSAVWDGKGGLFGSWDFVVGCALFWIGANLDFIQTIRYNHRTPLRQVLRAFTALFNYMATSIFILGGLYFLPSWYVKAPELGCWAFIIGCVLFCLAALADVLFICMTHEDPHDSGFRVSNLFSWGTLSVLGTFVGALCFIIGSWFYMPGFINRVDEGTHYMNTAITYYVLGSVSFIVSSAAMAPDVYRAINATSSSKVDK